MMYRHSVVVEWIFGLAILMRLCSLSHSEDDNGVAEISCVDIRGQPQFCYPPFQNYASTGRKVIATNTCGLRGRQKYCIGLSSAEMRTRCAYCDNSNVLERHSADYLTDLNPNNWWQSETLSDNKDAFNQQSINLTLDLGNQFHVTFIHLQFKSPRPSAMVIYKKYDSESPWQPWQYFARNCKKSFNMDYVKGQFAKRYNEVMCTEEFSSLNEFYDGTVMFATIYSRPGAENFFANKHMMDWATASQIRIELRKMHTFGEQNDEEELLLTYFYAIKNLQIAARCWCNGHGNECRKSTGEGLEPQLYCVCHPSHHTTGQTCEKCDTFYQDRPWQPATVLNANICQRCNCNDNSDSCIFNEELYLKSGNISGGLCVNCRWNTKGPHCNECLDGFYPNPEQRNRCIPCHCDPVGRTGVHCDHEGRCSCQPGIEGDKCTRCKGDHFNFGPMGCQPCNCHLPGVNSTDRLQCNPSTGICYCKKNVMGEKCDICVGGYFSLTADDTLGCRPCFCFAHTKDCTMASGYLLTQIESEFNRNIDEWKYEISSTSPEFTPLLNKTTKPPSISWSMKRDPWRDDYFFIAPKKFLGNRRLSYNLNLILTLSFGVRPKYKHFSTNIISMINDVQLISDTLSVSVPFDIGDNRAPEIGYNSSIYLFRLNEVGGLWRDQLDHFRFQSILNNLTAIRIRSTNPFGYVRLHKAVMETALDKREVKSLKQNLTEAKSVEKCSCPPQYTGLSCEHCAPGYHREYPVGTEFVKCIKCFCNNQSEKCDVRTGKCDCKYNTEGHDCDKCHTGFYGDPTTQMRNVCKPCGCPGGTSCELVKMADGDKVVCTDCPDNLGGYRCDRCRDNYFGNPKFNISCQKCQCHGNIDYFSSCNSITGKCPNCIYNSAGDHCESCKQGFYLLPNEMAPHRCKPCICNPFGSKSGGSTCDISTGNCFCEPLVMGKKCDVCKPGFFNLTGVKACQPCNCLLPGSYDNTCDENSGQCKCKPGVVGLHCDRCEFGYFNLSSNGCQRCLCDFDGSTTSQCHSETGQCFCKPNVIGMKCDKCLENHHNLTNIGCQICPPCYGLIQRKVNILNGHIHNLIQSVITLNTSDDRLWNMTTLMDVARQLNETLFRTFQNYVANFDKIKNFGSGLSKANLTLRILEENVKDFQGFRIEDKMLSTLNDIRNTEQLIKGLLDIDFKTNLDLLENYIKNKNEKNEKITRIAESANIYQLRVTQRKDIISKASLKAEQYLNESLSSFVDLIGKYNQYMLDSSQFNVTELSALSNEVRVDSMDNLLKISSANATLTQLGNQVIRGKDKMEGMVNLTNDLLVSFVDAKNKIIQLDSRFQNLVTNLPDMKLLERQVKNKTDQMIKKRQVFTEALEMKAKLDEAQENLDNAISKANQTIIKLQDLYKDFNDVVNKSKVEAEEQIKRLPQLRTKLMEMEEEINKLNSSSLDIIAKIIQVHNDLKNIYQDSSVIRNNITDFTDEIQKLLRLSQDDLEDITKIETLSEKKLKKDLSIENELLQFSNDLGKSEELGKEQTENVEHLQKALNDIMNQLLAVGNQSNLANEISLQQHSKTVDSLSEKVDNYYTNEFSAVFKNLDELNQELPELSTELELVNKSIRHLEMIEDHMVEVNSNVCYKSGGKTEGYV